MTIIEALENGLTAIREAQTDIINTTADFCEVEQLEDLLPMDITKAIEINGVRYLIKNETVILRKDN